MWGIDLTTTITGEGQGAVFVAIDHCSTVCRGLIKEASRTAAQLVAQTNICTEQHGCPLVYSAQNAIKLMAY